MAWSGKKTQIYASYNNNYLFICSNAELHEYTSCLDIRLYESGVACGSVSYFLTDASQSTRHIFFILFYW